MKTKVGLMKGLINLSSFTNKKKKKTERKEETSPQIPWMSKKIKKEYYELCP